MFYISYNKHMFVNYSKNSFYYSVRLRYNKSMKGVIT
nr:MAG TPA: hypothetical protein [Bacteriophage sp.]